jgi:Mismatch repair ATPase (MutS family)
VKTPQEVEVMAYVFGDQERQLYSALLEPDGAKRRASLDACLKLATPVIQAAVKDELKTYIHTITENMLTEQTWKQMEKKFRGNQNTYHLVMDIKFRTINPNERYKGKIPAPIIPKTELDLHGKYADEAIQLVDKFLAESYNTGEHQVWIIHGKGTGVLREEVRKHLKMHPLVLSYAPADAAHGEDGATQVDIKDRIMHYTP